MDPKIRKAIIEAFKDSPVQGHEHLLTVISKKLDIQEKDVFSTILLMKDAKEIDTYRDAFIYRLTLPAIQSSEPWPQRWKRYMVENWIAILGAVSGVIGAITSIVAIVISIIALNKP